jgi:hypothetical protein
MKSHAVKLNVLVNLPCQFTFKHFSAYSWTRVTASIFDVNHDLSLILL